MFAQTFIKTKKRRVLVVFLIVGILSGCAKENIGTEEQRQRDRDHETSNLIAKDYAPINGLYAGVVNNSDVFLKINTVKVPKDTSSVPSPVLEGQLVFAPRVAVGGSNQRVKLSYPYINGAYDPSSGDFSFSLEEQQRPSQVRCKASTVKVSCALFGRMNEVDFVANRAADNALEKLDSKSSSLFGGVYVGKTPAAPNVFSVRATFNTGFVNLTDSMMPELRVIGNFTFSSTDPQAPAPPQKMAFSDGNYDVSSGTIAMTVTGTQGNSSTGNTPVNCTVETSNSIMCRWYALTYEEFRLTRASNK